RVVRADQLMDEAKKVGLRMAALPAIAMKQNKEAINRAYDMRGLMSNIEYGQEMFCLTSMAQSPEGQEFRKIAREQGLKAAIRWRDERFKNRRGAGYERVTSIKSQCGTIARFTSMASGSRT